MLFMFSENFEKISYPSFGKSSPTIPNGIAEPWIPAAIVAYVADPPKRFSFLPYLV